MTTPAHDHITRGEILAEEFLGPLGISQYRLAQATGLSQTHISQVVKGKRRITPDAGLRIARALGVSDRYWIDLPDRYLAYLVEGTDDPVPVHELPRDRDVVLRDLVADTPRAGVQERPDPVLLVEADLHEVVARAQ